LNTPADVGIFSLATGVTVAFLFSLQQTVSEFWRGIGQAHCQPFVDCDITPMKRLSTVAGLIIPVE